MALVIETFSPHFYKKGALCNIMDGSTLCSSKFLYLRIVSIRNAKRSDSVRSLNFEGGSDLEHFFPYLFIGFYRC